MSDGVITRIPEFGNALSRSVLTLPVCDSHSIQHHTPNKDESGMNSNVPNLVHPSLPTWGVLVAGPAPRHLGNE